MTDPQRDDLTPKHSELGTPMLGINPGPRPPPQPPPEPLDDPPADEPEPDEDEDEDEPEDEPLRASAGDEPPVAIPDAA